MVVASARSADRRTRRQLPLLSCGHLKADPVPGPSNGGGTVAALDGGRWCPSTLSRESSGLEGCACHAVCGRLAARGPVPLRHTLNALLPTPARL